MEGFVSVRRAVACAGLAGALALGGAGLALAEEPAELTAGQAVAEAADAEGASEWAATAEAVELPAGGVGELGGPAGTEDAEMTGTAESDEAGATGAIDDNEVAGVGTEVGGVEVSAPANADEPVAAAAADGESEVAAEDAVTVASDSGIDISGCTVSSWSTDPCIIDGEIVFATGGMTGMRVYYDGASLVEGTDYVISWADTDGESLSDMPTEPGWYKVTFTGVGAYRGTLQSYDAIVSQYQMDDIGDVDAVLYRVASDEEAKDIISQGLFTPDDGDGIAKLVSTNVSLEDGGDLAAALGEAEDGCTLLCYRIPRQADATWLADEYLSFAVSDGELVDLGDPLDMSEWVQPTTYWGDITFESIYDIVVMSVPVSGEEGGLAYEVDASTGGVSVTLGDSFSGRRSPSRLRWRAFP